MYFAFVRKKSIIVFTSLLLVIILCCCTFSLTNTYAVYFGGNLRKVPIYSVKRDDKKIAISFDCAWGVDYTDKLLSIMAEENVKCTFFMVEFWTEKYPDYVEKIDKAGHEIGTHSATHPQMSKLSVETIKKELTTSSYAIEKIIGKKVEVFRPPYGDYNNTLLDTAQSLGLYTIQWSVDSLDWKNLSANEIYNRVIKGVESGSIVLFHNQGLNTSNALLLIIKTLKEKGYEFVTIGELIYKDNYKIDSNGRQYQIS